MLFSLPDDALRIEVVHPAFFDIGQPFLNLCTQRSELLFLQGSFVPLVAQSLAENLAAGSILT